VPVGVTDRRTQRPRAQGPGAKSGVGPPGAGAHPAQPSSPLDPEGARWGKISAPGLLDRAAGLGPPLAPKR
jgi:hypothetical protein